MPGIVHARRDFVDHDVVDDAAGVGRDHEHLDREHADVIERRFGDAARDPFRLGGGGGRDLAGTRETFRIWS